MSNEKTLEEIAEFEAHYQYDTSYMRELLKLSPEGYIKFSQFMPMAEHRKETDKDVFFLAKIATMQAEDCGSCLQLSVRMAIEAGVPKEIVQAGLNRGKGLPEDLHDVYQFATQVATNKLNDDKLVERMEQRYGKTVIAELALCVAGSRVYPSIKRALGFAKSCSLVSIDI